MRRRLAGAALAATLAGWAATMPAIAQEASTHPSNLPQPGQAEGVRIDSVSVELRASGGSTAQDEAALEAARKVAAELEGKPFSIIAVMRAIARMERSAAVRKVDYRLLPQGANALRLVFLIDSAPQKAGEAVPSGILTGALGDFPVFYKDDRSLVTAIVAGGLGAYSDGNAWFGRPELFLNPKAGYLPGARTSWTEGSVEIGGGFATQLGDSDVYAFGALSGMKTWTLGADIFRDDDRDFNAIEKAYAGLLYADAANRNAAKIGIGRQTFTLNDGFLVNMVKGSVNAGERGASYLGPRLTNQLSVLAEGRFGAWRFNAFYIDPSELQDFESDSTFLGANLGYRIDDDLSFDGTVITIPQSKTVYSNVDGRELNRQGLNTAAAHLLWRNIGLDGLFIEAEGGHQWHPDEDVSAWAGYGTLGYIARQAKWTPSISYRYAVFSGDDPDTATFERWDPLLSTGLGIWLQGISFGKVISNSNLATQRVQANVVPLEALNVTFDYHRLRLPETGDLGSNRLPGMSSHDLGQEFTLSARWAINRNLYLQGVASYAVPGEALRELEADENWSTLQLSLYWGL